MTIESERLARLEGAYEHLATKADLSVLKADLAQLEIRLYVRLGGLMVILTGIIIAVDRLGG